MSRLLRNAFVTTAKAALIVAGAGFGLVRGFRLLDGLADNAAAVRTLEARLNGMESEIQAIRQREELLKARLDRAITADDLSAALDKAFERTQRGIEARFEDQARSVEALRAMVGQTDELLERLLDRLDSMKDDAAFEQVGA